MIGDVYKKRYWCAHCGKWISKANAVKKERKERLCCPRCGVLVRTCRRASNASNKEKVIK